MTDSTHDNVLEEAASLAEAWQRARRMLAE